MADPSLDGALPEDVRYPAGKVTCDKYFPRLWRSHGSTVIPISNPFINRPRDAVSSLQPRPSAGGSPAVTVHGDRDDSPCLTAISFSYLAHLPPGLRQAFCSKA